ncbi:sir2 family domain-containing protein [Ditylenchus destructor]|uniref:Sir2 family domain-containing protein n=1 Tax=Ditylenchus destructor TaxID=166010 RepID=A0AAD4R947_9BILA|nr:sir2 family domain-containing protein [Ditylenchus destructor]
MFNRAKFVPSCAPIDTRSLNELTKFMSNRDRLLFLTGAGVSTESGIPDYRSEKVGQYARVNHRPIQHHEFMNSDYWRRRFWARNFVAFPLFDTALPNVTHKVLANCEKSGRCFWLITQNVDGLHIAAGSTLLHELHGSGKRVVCMNCRRKYSRKLIQGFINELNPNWAVNEAGELAPDGDINIPDEALKSFSPPFCPSCGHGSILKTDVVFFGDNVARATVDECYKKVDECDGVIVMGSSLAVMSSYRFVWHAATKGIPIAIVNIGPTRADNMATIKIEAKCSEVASLLEK